MATDSSILAWRVPMDRGAWRVTVSGVTKSWVDWVTKCSNVTLASSVGLLFPAQPGDGEGWFTLRSSLTFHQGLIWKKGEQGQGWLAKSWGRNGFLP